ncbi:helix-turn-helix transcriptional regulator [uncultured Hyphomicrobium sp.]|uniref:helix-turn-helix domain-containing protein n=1 Tax=uncultured Hyphomicrobium sp. TaxID=194373 RepID=UPI0025FBEF58|nr:helix-turn-helix transcriptional regulator [uncultured Hyphomicrobium sp.]
MSTHTLRQWRIDKKITLAAMAELAGLSLWQLHRLENGKVKRIDLRDALAIEKATGGEVPPRSLVE